MAESQAVAKQALEKLEDQLTCAVCLDAFKDPKMLNCFHVFCKDCLQRLVVQDRQGQLSLCCPTCRRSTPLPPTTSVSGLQSAFHVHHLFEIQDALEKMKEPQKVQCEKCKKVSRPATSFCRDCGQFICATCSDVHANWEEFSSHEVVSMDQLKGDVSKHVPPKKLTHFCSKHKDQELRLYCETCEELICHDCTIRLHQGHQYDLISDTFEGHKADITASLEPVEKHMGITSNKLKQLDARCTEITEQRALVKANIHKEICGFIEMLKRREVELVGQVDQLVEPKLKNLAAQRDEIETIQAQLGSCLSFVKESLRTGSQGEIVKMRKKVVKQIKEMTTELNADALTPCEVANVGFVTAPNFSEDCSRVGSAYLQVIARENCYATGKGLEVATVNKKATASVYALDRLGRPCVCNIERITCQLISDSDAKTIEGGIMKIKDNQYEISYCSASLGRHKLHVKFDGEHIKASPFAVLVRRVFKQLGTPIMTITGLSNPWGVVVNKKGEIIIAESGAHCISVYSQSGEKLRSFGSKGSGQGQFNGPRGVVVDDDGNILVADTWNNGIQKFTADGMFITAVGCKRNKPLQFSLPTGIAIHPVSKRVYVSESLNYRVQILNPDLTPHSMFGNAGSGKGQFYEPRGIAFDSEQNVYVGENCDNTHIQVFTANGEHLRWLGNTKLNRPHDVGIDSNDTIYVCDTNNHQICIFDSTGTLLHSFGTKGELPGQFNSPHGLTVDKNGLIYVSDCGNGHVQIF